MVGLAPDHHDRSGQSITPISLRLTRRSQSSLGHCNGARASPPYAVPDAIGTPMLGTSALHGVRYTSGILAPSTHLVGKRVLVYDGVQDACWVLAP